MAQLYLFPPGFLRRSRRDSPLGGSVLRGHDLKYGGESLRGLPHARRGFRGDHDQAMALLQAMYETGGCTLEADRTLHR